LAITPSWLAYLPSASWVEVSSRKRSSMRSMTVEAFSDWKLPKIAKITSSFSV